MCGLREYRRGQNGTVKTHAATRSLTLRGDRGACVFTVQISAAPASLGILPSLYLRIQPDPDHLSVQNILGKIGFIPVPDKIADPVILFEMSLFHGEEVQL